MGFYHRVYVEFIILDLGFRIIRIIGFRIKGFRSYHYLQNWSCGEKNQCFLFSKPDLVF
jgi:hypothetical protein